MIAMYLKGISYFVFFFAPNSLNIAYPEIEAFVKLFQIKWGSPILIVFVLEQPGTCLSVSSSSIAIKTIDNNEDNGDNCPIESLYFFPYNFPLP